MAKTSDSSDLRDSTQRSLGFVGLSAIAHVGILIAVLLAPSFKSQMGSTNTAQAGEEISYTGSEIADAAAPATSGTSEANAPTEVLLADANDPNAVAMAASEQAPAPEPAAQAAAPVEKPVAPKEEAPAPKPAPIVKAARTVKAPKAAAPKATSAAPIETSEESDVAIQAALADARNAEELPKELDAPQMDDEAAPQPEIAKAASSDEALASEVKAEEAPASAPAETVAKEVAEEKAEEPKAEPVVATAAPIQEAKAVAAASPTGAGNGTGAPSATTSGTTSALSAPNANGQGTLGQSSGGARGSFGVPAGTSAIRDVRDLVAMPGNPKPTYPLQDKMSGKQGTAVLVGKVKADGTVTNVMVERSSGSKLMDQAAAQAFAKWRFRPGQEGMVRNPFQFQLVGDAREIPARLRTQ
jgi:TonB family protein